MDPISFYTAHSPSFTYLLWESPWLLALQNAYDSFWIFTAQAPEPTTSPQTITVSTLAVLLCIFYQQIKKTPVALCFNFLAWPVKESSTSRILESFDWYITSVGWIVENWFLNSTKSVYPWTWYHLSIDLGLLFCIKSVIWNFQCTVFQRLY